MKALKQWSVVCALALAGACGFAQQPGTKLWDFQMSDYAEAPPAIGTDVGPGPIVAIERDNRRLVQDDSFSPLVDQRVGCAEIDCQVGGK